MRQTITLMIALTALLLPAAALAARERVEVLQNQLEHPWALAFLPDDRGILMPLRGGELRLWQREKRPRACDLGRTAGLGQRAGGAA